MTLEEVVTSLVAKHSDDFAECEIDHSVGAGANHDDIRIYELCLRPDWQGRYCQCPR